MGILNIIKGELIDIIEWTDNSTNTMVYRFPDEDKEIKMNAQLTVRESQAAVFVNEGQIADVYGPGRYTLTTQNMPILTTLKSWKYGFESPFKAEVYFVNTKQFTEQKWGTMNPIMMRDSEFGMIRLRAYGIYSYRIEDPAQFLRQVFGTNGKFDTESISGQLKGSIVPAVSDMLAEFGKPAIDLALYYNELSTAAVEKIQGRFKPFGLKLESFYIENISLPEEVEKVLDQRTSMGVIGDLNKYTQYQAAQAIRDAAQNEGGGLAGAGVGLGAGAALGNVFAGAMNAQNAESKVICPNCGAQAKQGSKFCPDCGKTMIIQKVNCIKCGAAMSLGAKFCPECGASQEGQKCPKCAKDIKAGAKFCPECGTAL